jgi:hypothetical protein
MTDIGIRGIFTLRILPVEVQSVFLSLLQEAPCLKEHILAFLLHVLLSLLLDRACLIQHRVNFIQ